VIRVSLETLFKDSLPPCGLTPNDIAKTMPLGVSRQKLQNIGVFRYLLEIIRRAARPA
jgi:hypothetical protein